MAAEQTNDSSNAADGFLARSFFGSWADPTTLLSPLLQAVPPTYCKGCKTYQGVMFLTSTSGLCSACEVQYLERAQVPLLPEGEANDFDPLEQAEVTLDINRKEIIKEGPLQKRFRRGKEEERRWTSFWCMIYRERLIYFHNREDALENSPLGSVNLHEATIQHYEDPESRLPCIHIRNEGGDHYFAATNPEEAREWYSAMTDPQPPVATEEALLESFLMIGRPTRFEATPYDWDSLPQTLHTFYTPSQLNRHELITIQVGDLAVLTSSDLDDPEEYFSSKQDLSELATIWRAEHSAMDLLTVVTTDSQLPSDFPSTFQVEVTMGRSVQKFKVTDSGKHTTSDDLMHWMLGQSASSLGDSVFFTFADAPFFVLKPTPTREYVFETVTLASMVYVRECVAKGRLPVRFSVVQVPGLDLNSLRAFNQGQHLKTSLPSAKAYRELRIKQEEEQRMVYATKALTSSISLSASITSFSKTYRRKIVDCFDSKDVSKLLEVKILSVNTPNQEGDGTFSAVVNAFSSSYKYAIKAGIYYGGSLLTHDAMEYTEWRETPVWNEWIRFRLPVFAIPPEARICIVFCACKTSDIGGEIPERVIQKRGWINLNLFQSNGILRQGRMNLSLWSNGDDANPLAVSGQNIHRQIVLDVDFGKYGTPHSPIVHHSKLTRTSDLEADSKETPQPSAEALVLLEKLASADALSRFNAADRKVIWYYRDYCRTHYPTRLARVLACVNWIDPKQVREAHKLLKTWGHLPPIYAMELLDGRYADEQVRTFAVDCLRNVTDNELIGWLAQLVQVLKYEPYHCSALSEYLLLRAVRSLLIGHAFFWHLQSELHNPMVALRFELLMEAFMKSVNQNIAKQFQQQLSVIKSLREIASRMKKVNKAERKAQLITALEEVQLPSEGLLLPFNPRLEVTKLAKDKCKVMGSATAPLWLVFKDRADNDIIVIFKTGDDLRTDVLMLQMIGMMDKIWKQHGLDLHMQPYSCICTGFDEGMIQVISGAETASDIQVEYAERNGYTVAAVPLHSQRALLNPLKEWLELKNPGKIDQVVSNFLVSCAGYSVATFILGIGDRHNDNIMVSYNGNFFHIDFGFVLGNVTKIAGVIARETAPFVFTWEMADTMGGLESENGQQFIELCCQAYNLIRKNADDFLILLMMMVATGISQLRSIDDLQYVKQALHLELTEEEAAEFFKTCIFQSLNSTATTVNFISHLVATRGWR